MVLQEAEMLRPRVPALEAEVARLEVEVQDRNKGLRDAQNEEGLARAQVTSSAPHGWWHSHMCRLCMQHDEANSCITHHLSCAQRKG